MKTEGTRIEFDDIQGGDKILHIERWDNGTICAREGVVHDQTTTDTWVSKDRDVLATRRAGTTKAITEHWLIERPGPPEPRQYGATVTFGSGGNMVAVLTPVANPRQWIGQYGTYTWTELQSIGNVVIQSEGVEIYG